MIVDPKSDKRHDSVGRLETDSGDAFLGFSYEDFHPGCPEPTIIWDTASGRPWFQCKACKVLVHAELSPEILRTRAVGKVVRVVE